jgi:glycosyltransferase involved in cell wall biosynthesis/SAM-dependent methyltransferase
MLKITTSLIEDIEKEIQDAKAYWKSEGVHPSSYEFTPHYVAAISEIINSIKAESIFEFGCGSGRNLDALSKVVANRYAYFKGVDINEHLVSYGRDRFGVDVSLGDETYLGDIEDKSYDVVFTISVLDHIPDPKSVLNNIARICKGVCIFIEPCHSLPESRRLVGVKDSKYSSLPDASAPFTYVHNVSDLLKFCGLQVALDIPFPTHASRSGPLYRLWVAHDGLIDLSADVEALRDQILNASFIRLLANIYDERKKNELIEKSSKDSLSLNSKLKEELKEALASASAAEVVLNSTIIEKESAIKSNYKLKCKIDEQERRYLEVLDLRKSDEEKIVISKAEIRAAERIVDYIYKENESLSQKLDLEKDSRYNVEKKIFKLELQLLAATSEKDNIKRLLNDFEIAKENLSFEVNNLRSQVSQLRAERSDNELQIKQLEKDKLDLEEICLEANERLSLYEADYNVKTESINKLEKSLSGKNSQIARLQKEIQEKNDGINELNAKFEKYFIESGQLLSLVRKDLVSVSYELDAEKAKVDTLAQDLYVGRQREAKLEKVIEESQNAIARQLGDILIAGINSWRGFAKIPISIYRLYAESQRRRAGLWLLEDGEGKLAAAYGSAGLCGIEALMDKYGASDRIASKAIMNLARQVRPSRPAEAAEIARLAFKRLPTDSIAKWLAFCLYEAGAIQEPYRILSALPAGIPMSKSEKRRFREISTDIFHCSEEPTIDGTPIESNLDGTIDQIQKLDETGGHEVKILPQGSGSEVESKFVNLREEYEKKFLAKDFIGANKKLEQALSLADVNFTNIDNSAIPDLKRSPVRLLSAIDLVPDKASAEPGSAVQGRLCYVLHNSLPYSSGGYATRAHGVAKGLRQAGVDVVAVTRSGFPYDTNRTLKGCKLPDFDIIDGVKYGRLFEGRRRGNAADIDYIKDMAFAIERFLRKERPGIVMAASAYPSAFPALIAAKRLGLPFIYEVRGFWEVTQMSRTSDRKMTPLHEIQEILETEIATRADHVFTLTSAMKDELLRRGVSEASISLAPNSCDPSRFEPRERDTELAASLGLEEDMPVIGYVGTFVDYEGLDDLVDAAGRLKLQGFNFRLLLVGNENVSGNTKGPITAKIESLAAKSGLDSWLIMPGRVPHDEVQRYYSLIDIAPFPRKPWPVCEMVSPMKPLEACAMEKAVVVSSVRALSEMIGNEDYGLTYEKGNIDDLALVLGRLITQPSLRTRLGKRARKWVVRERTWERTAASMNEVMRAVRDHF